MITNYYKVNGKYVPASQCNWVLIAPCGCECAWALTEYAATEEQAWENFSRPEDIRRRDEKRGYRMTVKQHKDICSADCPHTPKWGVEPRPTLKGHTWAVKRSGRGLHLVPLEIEKNGFVCVRTRVPSACGKVDAYLWSTHSEAIEGQLDCAACVTRANQLVDEAVSR